MTLSSRFYPVVSVLLLSLVLAACARQEQAHSIATVLPSTSRVQLTFDEKQIPEQCRVFAHLILSVPALMPEIEVKNSIEQYAMDNGADFILFGMTRESRSDPETVVFRFYGPDRPYLFKRGWLGWKFGFKDWNSGGPLIDFGYDRLSSTRPAFEVPADALAVLLTCQVGPQAQ